MPRGAEEGERGDGVRGARGFPIIGNSREGAAPRGACLAWSSAVSGPCGAVAGHSKIFESGRKGTAWGVMGREPSLGQGRGPHNIKNVIPKFLSLVVRARPCGAVRA
jgi:hypothetical protein